MENFDCMSPRTCKKSGMLICSGRVNMIFAYRPVQHFGFRGPVMIVA